MAGNFGGPAGTIGWAIGKPGGGREKSERVGGIVMRGVIMGMAWFGAVVMACGGGCCGEPLLSVTGAMRDMREGSLLLLPGVDGLFGI